jgi:signal transduction histidine kinase
MASNEIRHRAQLVKKFGKVPMVQANESRLGQVFLNLIVNGAQAIPEGRAAANRVEVTTELNDAGRVVVSVRDSGGGIPADKLDRVFDPFFTTKPAGQGTGLGLAICHRIVTESRWGSPGRERDWQGHGLSRRVAVGVPGSRSQGG